MLGELFVIVASAFVSHRDSDFRNGGRKAGGDVAISHHLCARALLCAAY